MPVINVAINVRPNDNSTDNRLLAPAGGAVFLELNRGFNCVIPSFGIAVCTHDPATGGFKVERTIAENGQFPPAENPNAPAPLYNLGAPAGLLNRCVVVVTSAAALPPGVAGSISVILHLFQQNADQSYRRVDWEADSTRAVQLQSRFEIDLLP
jgi:hypothetical protein